VKIYDSVHGFIRLNDVESELIDSLPFQRLHYIHQLGIAYLVYPGGTHTRFEHSLGVMEVASLIFDRITADTDPFPDRLYWRQLLRLAALCHDLGHLPFSHVAEKALLGREGHEKWTLQIINSPHLEPVWERLHALFPQKGEFVSQITKLAIGEKKLKEFSLSYSFSPWESLLAESITGDFFGADRIDYLLRDAQCTGVAYGLIDYHQLIEMLRILPFEERLCLGVEENGIQSCEALLLARHFMYRRVYQYPTAKAYAFHLARFMKAYYTRAEFEDIDSYLRMTDSEILAAMNQASRDPQSRGYQDAKALFLRRHRFKAVELAESSQEASLNEFKKSLNIPDESMEWEFSERVREKMGLNFPVLRRSGAICHASSCSQITIPPGPAGWVYVSPELEKSLCAALEKLPV
jgi:uncharacterized protein